MPMRHSFVIICLLFLAGHVVFGQTTKARNWCLIGVAKVDVTPKGPVVLAGYGGRTTEHEGIDTKLWARAMVMGNKSPVAVVVLDNCGVPAGVTRRLAQRLVKHGIASRHLVVAATHTHNAPSLVGYAKVVWAGRMSPAQEKRMAEYTTFAIDRMESAVLRALKNRQLMQLEWAQGRVGFGGNRRVLNNGKWAGFGFQRNGPVDHSLPVLAARDADGKVRALWANYACHCTTVGSRNRVGGDWAGFANASMETDFPGAVSLMSIGCGADIGPVGSGLQIAEKHGRTIATEVKRLLATKTTPLTGPPVVSGKHIQLPLIKPQPRVHWEAQLRGSGWHHQLAKAMLAKLDATGSIPAQVNYPVSVWKFGDDLAMVFLAGEVVVDYSVRLNRELDWTRLWISAWANDMPGYIPSRRVLAEGGYEADFSQVYYEQPGRYDPKVEDAVVNAVKELVGRTFEMLPGQKTAPFHTLPSGEAGTFNRVAKWAASKKSEEEMMVLQKVRQLIPNAIPAIGRMLPGDAEQTEWFNFAGDHVRRVFIRQKAKGTTLRWQSPKLVENAKGSITLCFTGGVGWESAPKTGGFTLLIGGSEALQFDVTRKANRWVSKDTKTELVYLPTWTSPEDSGGFFFLTLTNVHPEANGAISIAVRSLGRDSMRWFAIDAKQEIRTKLNKLSAAITKSR